MSALSLRCAGLIPFPLASLAAPAENGAPERNHHSGANAGQNGPESFVVHGGFIPVFRGLENG